MDIIKNTVRKKLLNPVKDKNQVVEKNFSKYHTITYMFGKDSVLTITQKETDLSMKHILFFHGGAYVQHGSSFHKNTVKRFVKLGYRVSYFEYPLGPKSTIQDMVDFSLKAYHHLISVYKQDDFVIFGDSAGGGLALLFQIKLRETDKIIYKSALSSPWLDISLSNKEIDDYEQIDRFLPRDTLIDIGKIIAGDLDPKNPRVSPIYDDLEGLGEIHLYYTDSEILTPDCNLFTSKIKELKRTTITSKVAHKLPHDYVVITHFPQSKKAIEEIHQFYHNND